MDEAKKPVRNYETLKSDLTHIVYSIANGFKDLEESMNVLDPVQNHLLFLRNPSRILNSLS